MYGKSIYSIVISYLIRIRCLDSYHHRKVGTLYQKSEHLWFRNGQIASKLNVVLGCISHTQPKIAQDQSLKAEYNLAIVGQ